MAKAPAFQFYVRDWLAAPEVRRISPMARGIWIDVLCFMWEEREQGKLTCSILELSRMTGATLDEAVQFVREAERHELCNLKISGDVTNGHADVTLINRRMYGEWKDRESARLRKQKQRKSQVCPDGGHDEVTSCSSSASATTVLRNTPSDEGVSSSEPSASADTSATENLEPGEFGSKDQNDQPAQADPETGKAAPKRAQGDQTPHQAIVALYHEILPMCPRVKVWNPEQRSRLRTRWNESPERKSLDWWRDFFQRVAASDWLTGRVKDFVCDLDWLVGPKNMAKVLNGRFDNRGPRTGSQQADRNARAAQAFVMGD